VGSVGFVNKINGLRFWRFGWVWGLIWRDWRVVRLIGGLVWRGGFWRVVGPLLVYESPRIFCVY